MKSFLQMEPSRFLSELSSDVGFSKYVSDSGTPFSLFSKTNTKIRIMSSATKKKIDERNKMKKLAPKKKGEVKGEAREIDRESER
jgi:hypothetical protein